MRAAVLPEVPDPMGIAGATEDRQKQLLLTQQLHPHDNAKIDPTHKPGTTSFWDKYRARHQEWKHGQAAAASAAASSSKTHSFKNVHAVDATEVHAQQTHRQQRKYQNLGSPESMGSIMSLDDDE